MSEAGSWRCLAELGKADDKVDRPADAIRATELAINLALRENDPDDARALREDLARYELGADRITDQG